MSSTEVILSPAPELQTAALFTPTPKAAKRVLEFFTAQINNGGMVRHPGHPPARRRSVFRVAAFVKDLQGQLAAPPVKQHLAALRN